MSRPLVQAVAVAFLALAPIAQASAQSAPPVPPVTVTAMPSVQQNPAVMERDGTYSTVINGVWYWAFNDTALTARNASRQNFFSNSLSWSTSLDASNGIVLNGDQLDSKSLPTQFIPFNKAEMSFNRAHAGSGTSCHTPPCGEGLAIWPGPIVYNPDTQQVIIPFVEIVRGGPIKGFPTVGGGISVGTLTPDGFAMTRPVQGTGTDPGLMWTKGAQIFTDQAFLLTATTTPTAARTCSSPPRPSWPACRSPRC